MKLPKCLSLSDSNLFENLDVTARGRISVHRKAILPEWRMKNNPLTKGRRKMSLKRPTAEPHQWRMNINRWLASSLGHFLTYCICLLTTVQMWNGTHQLRSWWVSSRDDFCCDGHFLFAVMQSWFAWSLDCSQMRIAIKTPFCFRLFAFQSFFIPKFPSVVGNTSKVDCEKTHCGTRIFEVHVWEEPKSLDSSTCFLERYRDHQCLQCWK